MEGNGVVSTTAIFVAEFVGTFFLTFIGAGSILQSTAMGEAGFGLLGIAIAHGVALSIAVSATGAISGGHINPAVTLGLFVAGKVRSGLVPVYIIAQCLGSFVGALLLRAIFPAEVVISAGLGTPAPAPGVSFGMVI